MKLLNKLTIKNLKLNKKRTIVTIIGIMLSVALITAVAAMYSSGVASLISFEIKEKGNFHVAFFDVPTTDIWKLKNNRDIEEIHLTKNIGYAKLENSKNEYKPYALVKAFTKDSLDNLAIKLVEGRLPENSNEILIPTHLKTNGRITLNVGEKITLDVGTRVNSEGNELSQLDGYVPSDYTSVISDADTNEILYEESGNKSNEQIINTKSMTYEIVGIIERPSSNVENYSAPGYTFVTYLDENNLTGKLDVYTRYTKTAVKNDLKTTANILGVDENDYSRYRDVANPLPEEEFERIDKEVKKSGYTVNENSYLIGLETHPIKSSGVGGLGVTVVIVCIIIVVTSIFCIKNSFDISITEKIKQYGMLRSIGATKRQIKRNVLYEASILGLFGIPLGILSGIFAAYILVIITRQLLTANLTTGMVLEFSVSWIAIAIAVVLGLITIYLSAIRGARKAAKISPIESIRNSGSIKIKAKKIRSPKIINKIFGIGGEISFKNLKRNKKKYRSTVISIVVSVSIFIALYSFMSLAFLTVDEELNMTDYKLMLSIDDKDLYEKAIETTKLDGIKNYTVFRTSSLNIKNVRYNKEYTDKVHVSEDTNDKLHNQVAALGEEQYKKYVKSLGLNYEDVKDKAIIYDKLKITVHDTEKDEVINYQIREFDYKKGDTFDVEFSDKKTASLKVGGIAEELPFGMKNSRYNSLIILSDELFDKFTKTDRLIIYYDTDNASKVQDDIDEMLKDTSYYLENVEENAQMVNNLYVLVGIFLYGFIIVISLIGITNIFNTITTNMELRKQEFAMLKSVGMTKKEFNRMIRLESVFMGVKALVFGIPIGTLLSYLLYYTLASEGIKYPFPILAITISIIAVFLLITCIMKYSMGKINKQNTIETIRNENI